MNDEQIDIDFEDLDQKIEMSDHIFFNQIYVPTMAIKDDNEPITHNFLKTFFRLEKANALIHHTDQTTPVLVLFDCGSGKTVGNQLESLDENESMKTTDITLSSLNGIDKSQKRVCKITLVCNNGEKFPLEVIIPKEEIPKPAPQNMRFLVTNQNTQDKKLNGLRDLLNKT